MGILEKIKEIEFEVGAQHLSCRMLPRVSCVHPRQQVCCLHLPQTSGADGEDSEEQGHRVSSCAATAWPWWLSPVRFGCVHLRHSNALAPTCSRYHLGTLKAKLAKLRTQLQEPPKVRLHRFGRG